MFLVVLIGLANRGTLKKYSFLDETSNDEFNYDEIWVINIKKNIIILWEMIIALEP